MGGLWDIRTLAGGVLATLGRSRGGRSRILRALLPKSPMWSGFLAICELWVSAAANLLPAPADTRDHLFVGLQPEQINDTLRWIKQNNPATQHNSHPVPPQPR